MVGSRADRQTRSELTGLMSALATLRELSFGCSDSWELYLRTRGVDLDVTRQEWFDAAYEIELVSGAPSSVALLAAVRSTLCWTRSVFRPDHLWKYPANEEDDFDELSAHLMDEIVGAGEDVKSHSDDLLRRTYANLLLLTGGTWWSNPTTEQAWVQDRMSVVQAELLDRGLFGGQLEDPNEYRGQPRVAVDFGSHRYRYGAKKSRQLLDDWTRFFSEPSRILHLTFYQGAPHQVLDALRGQTQLVSLHIELAKTADFEFLGPLTSLETLSLDTYSPETDLEIIGRLITLRRLRLVMRHEGRSLAFLSHLRALEDLRLFSKRPIDSLEFARSLSSLRRFSLAARVSGKDYSPLVDRSDLEWLRIRPERGMRPSIDELQARIPGLVVSSEAELSFETQIDAFS